MKKSSILAFIFLLAIGVIGALASLKEKAIVKEGGNTVTKESNVTGNSDIKSDNNTEATASTGAMSYSGFSCDNVLKYPTISAYTGSNFLGDTGSTTTIADLIVNYYKIKELYIDNNAASESKYDYEYVVMKEMSDVNSDCSGILSHDGNDTYTYNICKLYKAKDLQKVDAFKFEEGDEKMKDLLKSLISGKLLPETNELQYNSFVSFEDFKKNVIFNLRTAPTEFLMNYIIYIKSNGEGAFLDKLNASFVGECKQLIKK